MLSPEQLEKIFEDRKSTTKKYKTLAPFRYFGEIVNVDTIVSLTDKEAKQLLNLKVVEPQLESVSEPAKPEKRFTKSASKE